MLPGAPPAAAWDYPACLDHPQGLLPMRLHFTPAPRRRADGTPQNPRPPAQIIREGGWQCAGADLPNRTHAASMAQMSAPPNPYWPEEDTSGLPSWDERIRALLPSSVDRTQIQEDLRLTPTERIEKLQALVAAIEELRGSRR